MASTRTQIYITKEQRSRLDALRRSEQKSLAELIREAIDEYLAQRHDSYIEAHLERTAGTIPDLQVPSRDEWDRDFGPWPTSS